MAGSMRILCVTIALVAIFLPHSMVKAECKPTPLEDRDGTIKYPTKAAAKEKCLFTIKVKDPAPKFVTLLMSNIILSDGGLLEIYDGDMSKKETQLYSISGSSLPQQIGLTFSNNVNIQYTVGDKKIRTGWVMSYTSEECKQNVSNAWVQKIESPKHLPAKDKGFQCDYTVTNDLPADRIPVVSMQLGLTDESYLLLTNDENTRNYTGDKTTPEDFFASNTSSAIEVTYKVTNASIKPTFSLVVDPVIEECSGIQNVSTSMNISRTISASLYAQYNCRWLLVASPETDRILAKVVTWSLLGGDTLKFVDGRSSYTTGEGVTDLSSYASPDYLFLTSAESLIIMLTLGNARGERKIELDVSPQEFGGRFTGSGTLTAGNKKADADEKISVYFQLLATSGKAVSTMVLTSLPENATLSFYDGLLTSDKLLTTFDSETPSIETVEVIGGPLMLLELTSFSPEENFTAQFSSIESGCDMFLTDTSGQLTFPGSTSFTGSEKCSLTIDPFNAEGNTLVLNFDSLTIGDEESVVIYSGDTKVAEFNKDSQASEVYVSGSTMAKISFLNSSGNKTTTTLSGRYSVQSNVCGGNLADSGFIVTPNYPNRYPLNAECIWSVSTDEEDLSAANKSFLYLNFFSLSLAPGHSINVSDMNNKSEEQLISYMGSSTEIDDFIVPVATGLMVKFSASAKDAGMKNQVDQGAKIGYQVFSCGGNMSVAGTFSTPGYPGPTKESATCVWIISADTDILKDGTNIVSMNITLKDKSAKALPSSLKIYDGPSAARSDILSVNITKGLSGHLLSLHNKVVIKYNYQFDSKTKDKDGFTLTFNTYQCNASQMCQNGKCLHDNWRCNGLDECGDNTDEIGCMPTPTPIRPKNSSDTSGYVKGGYVALLFFIALILGAVLVIVVPKLIRKFRGGGGGNYSRMNDNAPVVT